jgi:hypothetical protein
MTIMPTVHHPTLVTSAVRYLILSGALLILGRSLWVLLQSTVEVHRAKRALREHEARVAARQRLFAAMVTSDTVAEYLAALRRLNSPKESIVLAENLYDELLAIEQADANDAHESR